MEKSSLSALWLHCNYVTITQITQVGGSPKINSVCKKGAGHGEYV